MHLIARTTIGRYRKGDRIEDEAEVNALLKGEHRHHFIQVAADNGSAETARPHEAAAADVSAHHDEAAAG